MRGWASMIRASTPCGPQFSTNCLPRKHSLALVPALITDADLAVLCCVKRKGCVVRLEKRSSFMCFTRAHAIEVVHALQKADEANWREFTMEVKRDGQVIWEIPFEVSRPLAS